ncbi:MAG TPA: hypothetical protein VK616_13510 [Flavitalea sp.]|nr:hypothetical protein [Flavitalea sp.]
MLHSSENDYILKGTPIKIGSSGMPGGRQVKHSENKTKKDLDIEFIPQFLLKREAAKGLSIILTVNDLDAVYLIPNL